MAPPKLKIEYVRQYLEDNNCKLLSTFYKEYPNQKQKKKELWINYIATCGHKTSFCFGEFKRKRSTRNPIGRNCKDCSHKIANKNTNTRQENKEMYGNPQEQEMVGQEMFLKYVDSNEFDIYNTIEGAHADLLIKPKNEENWLNIQIKTTMKKRTFDNCYMFSNTRNYPKFLMVLVCIEEEIIWIMNGNVCCLKPIHLNLSKKGKYSKYLINNDEINDKIKECYFDENYKKTTKEEGCKSLCENYNKERRFFNMRMERLPFLDIEDFKIDNACTDAIINGHKVQDKLAQQEKTNKDRVRASIKKSNGIRNGKRTKQPYKLGDNDYYWFHLPKPFENLFYCIPERCLIENGYLKTETCKGRREILFYPKGQKKVLSSPCQKYIFNYDEIDENTEIFL